MPRRQCATVSLCQISLKCFTISSYLAGTKRLNRPSEAQAKGIEAVKILFETRFSFFGESGWRSRASRDPGRLFDPQRLNSRLALFEAITLPSLAGQSDPDFHMVVLSSDLMPPRFRKRLRTLCADMLGAERVDVLFQPFQKAGFAFRRYARRTFRNEDWLAQVVLDDDDALSNDFVTACKHEADHIAASPYDADKATFLSFASGYSVGMEGTTATWLAQDRKEIGRAHV